jgi:putative membrane protein
VKLAIWGIRFLIPLVVLYSIGYFVPGFSALTLSWIILLSVLILLVDWVIGRAVGERANILGRGIITFLISAVVIFTITMAIQGGQVPLGGAILAALIISLLTMILPRKVTS